MYDSILAVRQAVQEKQGVLTIQMEALRDAYGKGKLGKNVVEGISRELAGQGLAHVPNPLPSYQHEQVRLYLRGSHVGDLIEAATKIGEDCDELLRNAANSTDADILRQVRELVC